MNNFYLLKNIAFDSDYNNVISFDSVQQQTAYFNTRRVLAYNSNTANFVRPQANTISIEVPITEAQQYKYCMFDNTVGGVTKRFYAFITDTFYNAPNRTYITIKIDVWQTYLFDYELGDCFIDREHQDRFYTNLDGDMRPIFNTNAENLELGSDYIVDRNIRIADGKLPSYAKVAFVYINTTEPLHDTAKMNNTTMFGLPTAFYTYMAVVNMGNNGQGVYADYPNKQYPSVDIVTSLFGNDPAVMSINVTPYTPLNVDYTHTIDNSGNLTITAKFANMDAHLTNVKDHNDIVMYYVGHQYATNTTQFEGDERPLLATIDKQRLIKNDWSFSKYSLASINNEPKLLTHPYTYFSLGNQQNQPKVYKNEYLDDYYIDIKYLCNFGPLQKERINIIGYKGDTQGIYENVLNNTNNDLPLITDAYQQYISSNKASSVAGMVVPVASAVGGIALTAMGGGAVGVPLIMGGVMSAGTAIASHQTRISDLKQTPDTVRSSGNNIVFDVLADNFYYNLSVWTLPDSVKKRLYHYFMRLGYKSGEFKTPNLRSRYRYNYIKNVTTYIKGNFNENVTRELTNIFNNGTTIWHNRADNAVSVGDYSLENIEVNLL